MSDPGYDDIITVIARLAVGFEALNLPRPEAIVMKSHEDGMRLWAAISEKASPWLAQSGPASHGLIYRPGKEPGIIPIEGENGGVTYMEIEIYGTKIRWPAKKFALPGGGWRFC